MNNHKIRRPNGRLIFYFKVVNLLLVEMEMLYINGLVHLLSSPYGFLNELPSASELLYNAGLLEFSLEFLKSSLYVLAFFNRYYNHCLNHLLFLRTAKVRKNIFSATVSVQIY